MADVLAYQPGVYAQSPGNEGVKISIRGSGINRGPGAHASGNHIMLDGLPLTGSGGTPYELLEPLWLSRAEVLRGANAQPAGSFLQEPAPRLELPKGVFVHHHCFVMNSSRFSNTLATPTQAARLAKPQSPGVSPAIALAASGSSFKMAA